jgi:hypothetical protein
MKGVDGKCKNLERDAALKLFHLLNGLNLNECVKIFTASFKGGRSWGWL